MKKIAIIAAALATTLVAAPAMANDFAGARVEVTAGLDDAINNRDTTDVTYGVTAGVDFPVTKNVVLGVEANVDNVFDRREIGASARVGVEVVNNVLVYGKAGYTNYKDSFSRKLDGLRLGGGVEVNVSDATFVKAEYRYSDLEQGTGKHGALVGVGIRF